MGFQTGELRYALIAEVENPNTGRKLLTVSLHLHSGIERNAFFIQKINDAVKDGKARQEDFAEIVAAMEQDQERRLEEIRLLVKEIQTRCMRKGPIWVSSWEEISTLSPTTRSIVNSSGRASKTRTRWRVLKRRSTVLTLSETSLQAMGCKKCLPRSVRQ